MLLHGFLGSGRNLGAISRRWSAADPSVRLLQVDLPGHGQSPPLPKDATLIEVAEEILAFLDAIDLRKPISIVGHSMGGRAALALRRIAPQRVDRITLLDITPGPTRRIPVGSAARDLIELPERSKGREAMAAPLLAKGYSRAMVDWLLMNLIRDDEGYRWRIDREALHALHIRSATIDFWPEVAQAPERTMQVHGSDSHYVPPTDIERFEKLGVRVETIVGAGHFLHVDQPDEIAAIITRHALGNEP